MKEKLRFLGWMSMLKRLRQRYPNPMTRYEVLARCLTGWSRYAGY
jgi:hypothetical protein